MNPIAPSHRDDTAALAARFARREPFRHLVVDDFLERGFADRLLAEFPAFERGNARNEAGEPGGKSTVERIRDLARPTRNSTTSSAAATSWTGSAAPPASPTCSTTRGTSAAARTRTARARTLTRTWTSTAIRPPAGTDA
jgi:hypothetical protein